MRYRNRGFTLVELLVVIAIIGILVGLLLPAVQAAREAARRMACSNSLHNIALAMHNYHDVHKKFPFHAVCPGPETPGAGGGNYCRMTAGYGARHGWSTTWGISLLPHLEQQAMYDRHDSTRPVADPLAINNSRIVTGTNLAILKCSSDVRAPAIIDPDTTGQWPTPGTFDKGNYAINLGGGTATEDQNSNNFAGPEQSPPWATAFYGRPSKNRGLSHHRDTGSNRSLPSTTGIEDILDGTSNTVLFGEILKRNHQADCRGAWGKAFCAVTSAYTNADPNATGPDGIATPNARAVGSYMDGAPNCDNSGTIGDPQLACFDSGDDTRGGQVMRSRHPGGVQATFCDGRVTFISNTVDKIIYRALMTIQGGETASVD